MWISRADHDWLITDRATTQHKAELQQTQALERIMALERMNTRLQADLDWFKLRLNAVEKERAQLIAAAIGVKISIPEFVPQTDKLEDALNQMPDFSTVGGDAREEDESSAEPDYSMMPGYRGKK